MFVLNLILQIATLITGLVYHSSVRPAVYRSFLFVIGLSILNESLSNAGFYTHIGISKLLFYNAFFSIQLFVYGRIFYTVFVPVHKKIFIKTVLTLLLAAIVSVIYKGFYSFNPYFLSILSIGLILFASIYLYEIYQKEEIYYLKADPVFWFSIGIIIANFFFLLFVNAVHVASFKNSSSAKTVFKGLNTLGNIFYYVFLITSVLCSKLFRKQVGI